MKKLFVFPLIFVLCGCSSAEVDYRTARTAIETLKLNSDLSNRKEAIFFKSEYHEKLSSKSYASFDKDFVKSSFKFTYSSVEKIEKAKRSMAKIFLNDFKDCSFSDEQVEYKSAFDGLVDKTTTYSFNKEELTLSVESTLTYVDTSQHYDNNESYVLKEVDGSVYRTSDNAKVYDKSMEDYLGMLIYPLSTKLEEFVNLNDQHSAYYGKANMLWRTNSRSDEVKESGVITKIDEADLSLVQFFDNELVFLTGFMNQEKSRRYIIRHTSTYECYELFKFSY